MVASGKILFLRTGQQVKGAATGNIYSLKTTAIFLKINTLDQILQESVIIKPSGHDF
jgi:hypothetical protein